MAEAVLNLVVRGGEELRRVLGQVGTESAKAARVAANATRESQRLQTSILLREMAKRERAARAEAAAAEKAQRTATRAAAVEAAKRERIAKHEEQAKVKAAEREAKERARLQAAITKKEELEERKRVSAFERDERRKTTVAEREARRRERLDASAERRYRSSQRREASRDASRIGGAASSIAGGVRQAASSVHGMIQSERSARAASERELNTAFRQMVPQGATGEELARHRSNVYSWAQRNGMREEEIAPAIASAQSRFGFLTRGDNTEAQRTTNLNSMLNVLQLARDTGNDTKETADFFGAMMQSGFSSQEALNITRRGVAQGFYGSASLGEMSSQGLGNMMQQIATARARATAHGGNADQAANSAALRYMADMQIQAGVGARVGTSGLRESGLDAALQNNATVGMMRARLRERFRGNDAKLEEVNSMFVDGPGGTSSMAEAMTDPAMFATRLSTLFGGDTSAMANFMGAHGNWGEAAGGKNQILTKPIVRSLQNAMATPELLATRNRIMNADITPEQMRTLRGVTEGERDTTDARNAQAHREALTDNTSAIVKLSDEFAKWQAGNPIGGALLGSSGGLLGKATGALGGEAAPILASGGSLLAKLGGGGAGGLLKTTVGVGGALLGGLMLGDKINQLTGNDMVGGDRISALSPRALGEVSGNFSDMGELFRLIGRGFGDRGPVATTRGVQSDEIRNAVREGAREGIQNANVTATVSATDAAHAGALAATGPNPAGGANGR